MGFQTPQFKIGTLLDWAANGQVQLPDFQRDYKWDDERIRQLLVTVLRGHPMGVIMLLETGSDQVRFKPKPIAGVAGTVGAPKYLLLDGQQRMTSLYQSLTGGGVVHTEDDRKKKLTRRYFLDIEKALGTGADKEAAVVSLPEDGIVRENFGRDIALDVSTHEKQIAEGLLPFTAIFNDEATGWLLDYMQAGGPDEVGRRSEIFKVFNNQVLKQVGSYEIPAIELDNATSKEAVATVFEKVNTGGLALDVFELLTATFAGDAAYYEEYGADFRLGEDWKLTEAVIAAHPVLSGLQRTDFLQAVTLLATVERHDADMSAGRPKPAATSARREDILRLDLREYLAWAPEVRKALNWVAQFLTSQHIHTADFLPYRTMAVPLAVIRVRLGEKVDIFGIRDRIRQWYWCGVLGELYGSTTETRFARDTEQVPAWARAGVTDADAVAPETVRGAGFFESRLLSLKTRGSAAYKGVYALLMSKSCKDWKLDQAIEHANYLELQVDIHHIFPKAWCEKNAIPADQRESIINKTPLAKKTNIFLSGESPALYVPRLERTSGRAGEALDAILRTHLVEPEALRSADFLSFFDARRAELLEMIEDAMGKPAVRDLATSGTEAGAGVESPEAFEQVDDDLDTDDFDALENEELTA